MCKTYCQEEFGKTLDELQGQSVFIGDSPNDEPMFAEFQNSVAVKNIEDFIDKLKSKPNYICSFDGGHGFIELAEHLLSKSEIS